MKNTHPEDSFATLKIDRTVKKEFTRAVEDWYGQRKGYISSTAEEALREKTAELQEKIKARNGKR